MALVRTDNVTHTVNFNVNNVIAILKRHAFFLGVIAA